MNTNSTKVRRATKLAVVSIATAENVERALARGLGQVEVFEREDDEGRVSATMRIVPGASLDSIDAALAEFGLRCGANVKGDEFGRVCVVPMARRSKRVKQAVAAMSAHRVEHDCAFCNTPIASTPVEVNGMTFHSVCAKRVQDAVVESDACPSCSAEPGDGITPGCDDEMGCGMSRELQSDVDFDAAGEAHYGKEVWEQMERERAEAEAACDHPSVVNNHDRDVCVDCGEMLTSAESAARWTDESTSALAKRTADAFNEMRQRQAIPLVELPLTADTITDEQIRAMERDVIKRSGEPGAYEELLVIHAALRVRPPLTAPKSRAKWEAARARCAEIIKNARMGKG